MDTKLSFETYKILSSTFSNSEKNIEKLEVRMIPTINISEEKKKVILNLCIELSDKSKFKVEVEGMFVFQINCNELNLSASDNKEEIVKDFTMEAIKTSYFLLRSYISSYTALSGIMSILLPLEHGGISREKLELEKK